MTDYPPVEYDGFLTTVYRTPVRFRFQLFLEGFLRLFKGLVRERKSRSGRQARNTGPRD